MRILARSVAVAIHKKRRNVFRSAWSCASIALVAGVFQPAVAQVTIIETPTFSEATPAIGSTYRSELKDASNALHDGDVASASAALERVRAFCDALTTPGRRVVSVATQEEYEQFMSEQADGIPTDWIDISCPLANYMTGYILSGQKRFDEAFPWLEKAIAIAPYLPDPFNERGFIYAQTRRFPEALESYRSAIALADSHPAAAAMKPLSLRGVGWILTETGDLEGAQKAYEASLALNPDNATALNELAYIRKLRAAAAKPQPSGN